MNNFDDLFEQQPQKEAAPQKPEGQKERSSASGGRSARRSSARKPMLLWIRFLERSQKATAT